MPSVDHPLSSVPLDPYLDWAVRNEFRHQRDGAWVPLLVEFDFEFDPETAEREPRATALQVFTSLAWLDPELKKSVRVPQVFLNPPRAIASSASFNFCVLYVDKTDAGMVTTSRSWRRKITRMVFGPPFDVPKPPVAAPEPPQPPPLSLMCQIAEWLRSPFGTKNTTPPARTIRPPQTGASAIAAALVFGIDQVNLGAPTAPGVATASTTPTSGGSSPSSLPRPVAVAVLDAGIPYAHERFQYGVVSRIKYLLDLNSITELTGAAIESAIAGQPVGPAGEAAVYCALGSLQFAGDKYKALARRASHGAHVASIATKLAPGVPPARRPIIAVELPGDAVADPTGSPLFAYIFIGIVYALWRVEHNLSGGGPMPLVCNVSYGPQTGPHDGRDLFEAALDWLTRLTWKTPWPMEVVLAAGNFRQTRSHARFEASAAGTPIAWHIQPEDRLPNFIELWFPFSSLADISVTLTSPLGHTGTVSIVKPEDHVNDANGQPIFWMWFHPWTWLYQAKRVAVVIAVQPTATDPPLAVGLPTAPSGEWTVTVTSKNKVEIDAWTNRKVRSGARAKGRQAYFDDPNYVRFDPQTRPQSYDPMPDRSYVVRTTTLSGIATGKLSRVVGAFTGSTGAPTRYTSMGPVAPGGVRVAPDPSLLAVGDDAEVLYGVLAGGTRSGYHVAMNGTSAAAPQFAHWLAEYLAAAAALPKPYYPTDAPPVTPPPAGTPPDVAGAGCFQYPRAWYTVQRPQRPTL